MADAGQNHSTKKIGLGEALLRLTPDPPDVAQPSLPISFVFWNKRELAIQQLDAAIDAGDLPLFAFNEKTGELIQILALRWREHQPGWHRDMIISGAVKTSVGDAKLWIHYKDEDCRLVLLADDFDAWLEQLARKSATAISVSEAAVTPDQVAIEPPALTEPIIPTAADESPVIGIGSSTASSETMDLTANTPTYTPMPGDSEAVALARHHMYELVKADPDNRQRKTKSDFWQECQQFGISVRQFNAIRNWCIDSIGATALRLPGPRGPHLPPSRPRPR